MSWFLHNNEGVLMMSSILPGYMIKQARQAPTDAKFQELMSTAKMPIGLYKNIVKSLPLPFQKLKNDKVILRNKKFGLDMFMYSGKFAGLVSRVSDNKMLSVASGGYEQPVLTASNIKDMHFSRQYTTYQS